MITTAIYGVHGKMGQTLCQIIAASPDFTVAFGIDREPGKFETGFPVCKTLKSYSGKADLLIDFSHPDNLEAILAYASEYSVPSLIATTGLSEQQMALIRHAGQSVALLHAPNTSLGVAVVNRILREYSGYLREGFDVEIVEKHHNKKIDAPSGTAKLFASTINSALGDEHIYVNGRCGQTGHRQEKEVGIHSVRGGSITGEHTVLFAGEQETIEIKHTALSKSLFAHDALRLCRILVNCPAGLYTADDLYGQHLMRRLSQWKS